MNFADLSESFHNKMFHHQNLVGIQFHPERSGKPGVDLLSSIVKEFKL